MLCLFYQNLKKCDNLVLTVNTQCAASKHTCSRALGKCDGVCVERRDRNMKLQSVCGSSSFEKRRACVVLCRTDRARAFLNYERSHFMRVLRSHYLFRDPSHFFSFWLPLSPFQVVVLYCAFALMKFQAGDHAGQSLEGLTALGWEFGGLCSKWQNLTVHPLSVRDNLSWKIKEL